MSSTTLFLTYPGRPFASFHAVEPLYLISRWMSGS